MATLGSAYFVFKSKDNVSPVARGIAQSLGGLGKTGKAVFGTLAAAGAAAAAAIGAASAVALKVTKDAIAAAIDDDAQQQKLIATLKARGLSTEEATKRINELIEAGQKLAFTDTETRAGINIASQYTKKYAEQTKILTTAQNLARARNISLEAATKLVGKAYAGQGRSLKAYGVELQKNIHWTETKTKVDKYGREVEVKSAKQRTETVKGIKAVNLVNKQFAGVASQYAEAFAGQFDKVRDSIAETQEALGYAIGGGEGLPTFTKLLKGITPVVDDILGEIKKNLPNIQRFTSQLVDKFLAKLPSYVATAKREFPIFIDKAQSFILGVKDAVSQVVSFLGPNGVLDLGVAGLGAKFGGLGGALGSIFAKKMIEAGVDPITAGITGTIGGAIAAGVAQGLASQVAVAAVTKFLSLFKNFPVTPTVSPTVPLPTKGGGNPIKTAVDTASKAGPLALLGKFGATALVAIGSALAIVEGIKFTKEDQKFYNKAGAAGFDPATGFRIKDDVKSGVVEAFSMRDSRPPVAIDNRTSVVLDGKVVATSVSRYLGLGYSNVNPVRTNGR